MPRGSRPVTLRRVLITGSRRFSARPVLFKALFEQLELSPDGIVIVNGMNRSGADALAHQFYQVFSQVGVEEEPHLADWDRACDTDCFHGLRMRYGKAYCPRAGFLRNQEMVDAGADIGLALPLHESPGTWDCIKRAKAALIPLLIYDSEAGKWLEVFYD